MEVGEWEGKEVYVYTDFAPSAAFQKQFIQLLTNSSSLTVHSAAFEKQPCSNSFSPH